MWHLRTWFRSGLGIAELMTGLSDFAGLFQPGQLRVSMIKSPVNSQLPPVDVDGAREHVQPSLVPQKQMGIKRHRGTGILLAIIVRVLWKINLIGDN